MTKRACLIEITPKLRTVREAQAAANRVAHGRTKAEKQADRADAARAARDLDGAKRS